MTKSLQGLHYGSGFAMAASQRYQESLDDFPISSCSKRLLTFHTDLLLVKIFMLIL